MAFEVERNSFLFKIITLAAGVIAVASINKRVGDWTAYIGSIQHSAREEWEYVYKFGTKLSKELASVIFPNFADKYFWRD